MELGGKNKVVRELEVNKDSLGWLITFVGQRENLLVMEEQRFNWIFLKEKIFFVVIRLFFKESMSECMVQYIFVGSNYCSVQVFYDFLLRDEGFIM